MSCKSFNKHELEWILHIYIPTGSRSGGSLGSDDLQTAAIMVVSATLLIMICYFTVLLILKALLGELKASLNFLLEFIFCCC